jgi:hypothetical protein
MAGGGDQTQARATTVWQKGRTSAIWYDRHSSTHSPRTTHTHTHAGTARDARELTRVVCACRGVCRVARDRGTLDGPEARGGSQAVDRGRRRRDLPGVHAAAAQPHHGLLQRPTRRVQRSRTSRTAHTTRHDTTHAPPHTRTRQLTRDRTHRHRSWRCGGPRCRR